MKRKNSQLMNGYKNIRNC